MTGPLPSSPAAERNKQPILAVLERLLPHPGRVLEVASGTGQHVAHFAAALPQVQWQPSDVDAARRAAITARLAACGAANVAPPLALDVLADRWPVAAEFDAVLAINLIHVAPPASVAALCAGASRALAPGGARRLLLYGPFREAGRHTAPSNEEFDARLRAENPAWGVRDLGEVTAIAAQAGFARERVFEMPANNRFAVFALAAPLA
ncbi:MAG: DUF938 domain-containing protein [Proteobacteria bacterium]|nr:DUF938 domain-containing protein [Pseudomonadota bacterium]